jgi:hypothetical protein
MEARPSPGVQIFHFSRSIKLQRAGERFPGKSGSGTSKVTNPALAMNSLWAMARRFAACLRAFFPSQCP